jgi:hypothetical protein
MIHQKIDNLDYSVTIELKAEDLAWLCDLLATIIREPGADEYSHEDTEYLLRVLQDAERGFKRDV